VATKIKYKVLFISNFSLADSPLEKDNSEAVVNGRPRTWVPYSTCPCALEYLKA